MDSKTPIPTSTYEEDFAPPSYNDSVSHKSVPVASSSTSQYYSSQITSQLTSLIHTISSIKVQKSILSHAQDEHILSLLTSQIQIYLSEFAETGLQKGTLIVVPAAGLEDESALPLEYDCRDPEEFDKLVRARDKEADGSSGKWFWRDEEMATRLAAYLRPAPDPRALNLPPRKEEVALQQSSKENTNSSSSKWAWGRKRSSTSKSRVPIPESRSEPTVASTLPSDVKIQSRESDDRVVLDVKAEEIAFRTENDFGIFETERGWGIVVKLKVILRGL